MSRYSLRFPQLLIALYLSVCARAGFDLAYGDDSDLTNFVTRPEIRAPVFKITHRTEQGVTPGLWFLGPYAKVVQEAFPRYYYQACSTGPHIYDGYGNLVWSGACTMRNQNACDFRVFADANGTEHLSTIFHGYEKEFKGFGAAMDSSYSLSTARNITPQPLDPDFNMHEFKVVENGRAALYLTARSERVELSELGNLDIPVGWVSNVGFREVDLETGLINFEWWSFGPGKVSLTESSVPIDDGIKGPFPTHWNFFHPNSIDKSAEGDYMVSGRFVDTIYKIPGKDGSIMWSLGGRNSSFHLDGFNFSKQHDAQFLGYGSSGAELISLFDNAVAHQGTWQSEATARTSSCLIVALDHNTMTAKVVKQIYRPDGGLTALRGNFQHLPNDHTIASWSENAYVSEHDAEGKTVLEAKFASQRFVTYRAYKFNFTGHPTEPPTLKAIAYGASPRMSTTAWYVSWNGATEVNEWRFCRETNASLPSLVGSAAKTGFETTFLSDGFEGLVYVEAIAKNGSVIGRSPTQQAVLPYEWGLVLEAMQDEPPSDTGGPLDQRATVDKSDL